MSVTTPTAELGGAAPLDGRGAQVQDRLPRQALQRGAAACATQAGSVERTLAGRCLPIFARRGARAGLGFFCVATLSGLGRRVTPAPMPLPSPHPIRRGTHREGAVHALRQAVQLQLHTPGRLPPSRPQLVPHGHRVPAGRAPGLGEHRESVLDNPPLIQHRWVLRWAISVWAWGKGLSRVPLSPRPPLPCHSLGGELGDLLDRDSHLAHERGPPASQVVKHLRRAGTAGGLGVAGAVGEGRVGRTVRHTANATP
jgi:hypothetical protein